VIITCQYIDYSWRKVTLWTCDANSQLKYQRYADLHILYIRVLRYIRRNERVVKI